MFRSCSASPLVSARTVVMQFSIRIRSHRQIVCLLPSPIGADLAEHHGRGIGHCLQALVPILKGVATMVCAGNLALACRCEDARERAEYPL